MSRTIVIDEEREEEMGDGTRDELIPLDNPFII